MPRVLSFLAVLLTVVLAGSGAARATADGPDFYRLSGDDPVMTRQGPGDDFAVFFEVPAGADGLANLGCVGGLTAAEWQAANEEERAAARLNRWCRIGYDRQVGWLPGARLAEGAGPDAYRAGGRLSGLAGSEWSVVWLDGRALPPDDPDGPDDPDLENFLQFRADTLSGQTFCNRVRGSYTQAPGSLRLGPLAGTRMLCPGPAGELEQILLTALDQTRDAVAHHLVLVLLDEAGQVRVILQRRDWD